tara:strand:+ start:131 stop:448 length:318 start_codon:yes stop_codon:yes gene_type:complete
MKISKRQLRRIIREEKQKLSQYDFGSNMDRQRFLNEWQGPAANPRTMDDVSSKPKTLANTVANHLDNLEYWVDAYEEFDDPRAAAIDELLQQLYERLMAVQQGRD